MKAMRAGTPPPPFAASKDASVNERLLAVLTEAQARQWRDMTGEPLQGTVVFHPPPPAPPAVKPAPKRPPR
jgi:hypothetical protein